MINMYLYYICYMYIILETSRVWIVLHCIYRMTKVLRPEIIHLIHLLQSFRGRRCLIHTI
jgi:hypothetical protein